jgi:hypothetical protein
MRRQSARLWLTHSGDKPHHVRCNDIVTSEIILFIPLFYVIILRLNFHKVEIWVAIIEECWRYRGISTVIERICELCCHRFKLVDEM